MFVVLVLIWEKRRSSSLCSGPPTDWIYTVVSLSGLLLICWLVIGRGNG